MDPSDFKAAKAGQVVTCPEGYAAFVPAPLPPKLTFTRELAVALSSRRRRPGCAIRGSVKSCRAR